MISPAIAAFGGRGYPRSFAAHLAIDKRGV